jgi:selenocysteine lyase/cysteine desulfurase
MNRRKFLRNSGIAAGAAPLLTLCTTGQSSAPAASAPLSLDTWEGVRSQFQFTPERIHMSQMLLASHPKPVQGAIEKYRKLLDENPAEGWEANGFRMEEEVAKAAAAYTGTNSDEIVLTDSTTMGLGLLYTGLQLKPGDEILTSTHDHYSTEKSLDFAVSKSGASLRRVTLYADAAAASVDEIVGTLAKAIRPQTRIVALTWVHSNTGMKLPIRQLADVIYTANASRGDKDHILFCVDGVHGFGNQDADLPDLGCDFFVAGTHKWIFGPRGTGIVWGKKEAWKRVTPTIPAFSFNAYGAWLGLVEDAKINSAEWHTPGGFHSFEYRWALKEAFEFQQAIGRKRVHERTTELSTILKEGLAKMEHVKLHTPVSPDLSGGINCFEVEGFKPEEVVKRFSEKGIIASQSPYRISYARLTPCIANTEEEVDLCLRVLKDMKST